MSMELFELINNLSLKFIRPNNKDDIEYRSQMHSDLFVYQLQNIIAPNGTPLMDLRFHGTPIYFAQQIIETGSITSSMDRFGNYNNSTNINGEISASRIQDLKKTMDRYSDMIAYKRCMPAGCVFALFPRDYEDSVYGVDTMHNIDFRKNPQQLFGIFTTPENIKQVKGWMSEYGFNPDLVYNFEEFLKATQMAVLNITNKFSIDFYKSHILLRQLTDKELQIIEQCNAYKALCLSESVNYTELMNKKYLINKE